MSLWPGRTLLVLFACLASTGSPALEIGDTPPDVVGRTLDGKTVRLSDSSARLRIISFWATWCPPCRRELPLLAAVAEQGGAHSVEVIAINMQESRPLVRSAVKIMKDYPIRFAHDRNGTIARQFGVRGIPHLVIVDANDLIVYKKIGYAESQVDGIVAEVNRLIQQDRIDQETRYAAEDAGTPTP